MCVYTYICIHIYLVLIYLCTLFYFCLLSIFDYLLFDYCHVYFIICIVLFSLYMNMYVDIHMYLVSHSLVYKYSFLFGLTRLGVNLHT